MESRRFTEKLFDEVTQKLEHECGEVMMPFEEDET